ncbi:MAG: 50S ribosomal protein L4 [Methanoregulaceae archaeon]|jgi:large subunit ribosomal protein L4|nr:50S ribosomal protein L4 [Methanoregulaceae archaeon]
MANLEIKSTAGKKVGTHKLSEAILAAKPDPSVVHRTVVAEEANSRQGTQSARTRSEVRGGGRKPYKQKKTGNARQGTIRAPHFTHGGMAFAVKPRDYDKKVNKKERRAAILGVLNAKIESGDLQVVDQIVFAAPKTKDATAFLAAVGVADARRVLIIIPAIDEKTYRSFRNLPNVVVKTAPSTSAEAKTDVFSARDLAVAHKIVVAQDALKQIEEVWAK